MTTEYELKRLDEKTVQVLKFVDDELVEPSYKIVNSQCDCPGAVHHKVRCKHLKLLDAWRGEGEPNCRLEIQVKGRLSHVTVLEKVDPFGGEE